MRIWLIHQHAIPPIAMGPTRHFDLAKKLIEKGHEVFVIAGNYCHNNFHYIAEPYKKTKKINYYSTVPFVWIGVPAYKKNSLWRLWNMILFAGRLLDSQQLKFIPKPDVILGSSPSPFAAWAAQKLAQRLKVPFIYEIRDLWPATLLNLGHFSKKHPLVFLMQRIENRLLRLSDVITTALPGVKIYLQNKKIDINKHLWLPNAVDFDQVVYAPPLKNEIITVFYAGSFNISNSVETLLGAAKIIQSKGRQNIRIKLIGNGPLSSHLRDIVKNEQINNVEFLPTVAKEKIYSILREADLCVGMVKKTKLYQYGTSLNKISDYLALGRPVVFALDSPYSPISEANAGITVAPEDEEQLAQAILTIAALNEQEREQLGQNARHYAEIHYCMDKIVTHFITHISKIIK